MYKHLIIQGGGYFGFYILGAFCELKKAKQMDDIETIYGVSIGSYIGLLICLKINEDELLNYFINRPWHKTFLFSKDFQKGLLDQSFFRISLKNLLLSKDLSLETTFHELYNYSKIEFHLYVTELDSMKQIDISYKTHPNMKIIDGVSQSCSMPYIFKPVFYNDKYYLDGGIFNNFPLKNCIENGTNVKEILGFRFESKPKQIKDINNLFSFANFFQNKLIKSLREKNRCDTKIKCIYFQKDHYNLREVFLLLNSSSHRVKYIEYGKKKAIEFLSQHSL